MGRVSNRERLRPLAGHGHGRQRFVEVHEAGMPRSSFCPNATLALLPFGWRFEESLKRAIRKNTARLALLGITLQGNEARTCASSLNF
jgi:hypothetical protein